MLPSGLSNYLVKGRVFHAVLARHCGKLTVFACILTAYCAHVVGCQLSILDSDVKSASPTIPVLCIVQCRTEDQMRRIDALWNIARMANDLSCRNSAFAKFVRNTMCATVNLAEGNVPVPELVPSPIPNPTSVRLFDVFPKPSNETRREKLQIVFQRLRGFKSAA